MGASSSATDSVHGNTPLHWAVTGRNHHAIGILAEKLNVDFHAVNLNGETPIDMFHSQIAMVTQQNKKRQEEADKDGKSATPMIQFFVPKKIRDRFDEEFSKKSPKYASNGGSARYAKSPFRLSFTSVASNNCVTRAIVAFFKDKKVFSVVVRDILFSLLLSGRRGK